MTSSQQNISPQQARDRIVRRLNGLGAYRKRIKVTFGLILLIGALLAVAILTPAADALFFLPPAGRQILLAICGLGLFFVLLVFILIPMIVGSSRQRLARLVDAHYPELRNALVSALQLWRTREKNIEGYSTELMDAAVISAERRSRDLDLKVVVDRSRIKRSLRWTGGLLILAVVLFLIFPTPLRTAAQRLSHPRTEFERPPRTQLTVTPGDLQVTRHSDVRIDAQVLGRVPDEVRVSWKEGQGRWREEACRRDQERQFTHLFSDVKRDMLYQIWAGDARSSQYRITVIDRPRVVKLRLRYQYPAYTRLEPRVIEEDGNISTIVGTRVGLEIEANRDLAEAWLALSGDRRQDLVLTGRKAEGQLVVRESGSYAIHLRDHVGNENSHPIQYRIEAVADEPPMVEITFPAENVDMGENMELPLSMVAQDDYGISRAELVHKIIRLGEEFEEQRTPVTLPQVNMTRAEVDYLWDLSGLGLVPEDLVAYQVVVWDNDRLSGPKGAESRTFLVRFPSIHEILSQVQQEQSLQIEDIEEVLEEERILKERLDQIRRELENEDQVSWEQKKDVEGVVEQQEQIAQELAEIAEEMEKTLERAEERRVASTQIMEKMEQIRQLMDDVATPEMKKALEDLHKALQEMDPELVKQQMDRFSMTQEDLLERLDRTLNILKRLQAEQQLDALVKKTEDLLQRQQDIMEEMENMEAAESRPTPEEMEKLAGEQKDLGEEVETLPEEMKDLSELMSQFPEMPSEEMAKMSEQLAASELAENMSQASQEMMAGDQQAAQENQQKAGNKLQQLHESLMAMQSQMGAQMTQEVADAIRGSIRNLLEISQGQEDHRSRVQDLDRDSPRYGRLAEEQLSLIEAASQVANDVYQTAQKTFFISPQIGQALGRAMAQMGQALQGLEGRNGSLAAHAEKGAMVALNEAAQELISALDAMGSACSSGGMEGMMQRLQGMAQNQMSINQQTLGLNQQSGYTMDQRAQMARLAGEQEAMRKSMDDLLNEFGNRSDILGRLDQLGEEMKKVVDDLAQRKVDQRTIDRQQRILSRMLDAQKSVRRRDYSRRRQSRPGETVIRMSPGELSGDTGSLEDRLRRDLLRALAEDYPRAYEDLIRAYFQALSRTQEQ